MIGTVAMGQTALSGLNAAGMTFNTVVAAEQAVSELPIDDQRTPTLVSPLHTATVPSSTVRFANVATVTTPENSSARQVAMGVIGGAVILFAPAAATAQDWGPISWAPTTSHLESPWVGIVALSAAALVGVWWEMGDQIKEKLGIGRKKDK